MGTHMTHGWAITIASMCPSSYQFFETRNHAPTAVACAMGFHIKCSYSPAPASGETVSRLKPRLHIQPCTYS